MKIFFNPKTSSLSFIRPPQITFSPAQPLALFYKITTKSLPLFQPNRKLFFSANECYFFQKSPKSTPFLLFCEIFLKVPMYAFTKKQVFPEKMKISKTQPLWKLPSSTRWGAQPPPTVVFLVVPLYFTPSRRSVFYPFSSLFGKLP